MNATSFDAMTRSLTSLPSRRDILRGIAGAGLGLGIVRLPAFVEAKKNRKRKKNKKKVKLNDFGCVNVGGFCKNDEQCCSGICDGKKEKRKCRAHDVGTCNREDPGFCEAGNPLLTLCNGRTDCFCFRTTGDSKMCGGLFGRGLSGCADCQTDTDCLALGFPAGSACAPLGGDFACKEICVEGGMACIVPCGTEPPPP